MGCEPVEIRVEGGVYIRRLEKGSSWTEAGRGLQGGMRGGPKTAKRWRRKRAPFGGGEGQATQVQDLKQGKGVGKGEDKGLTAGQVSRQGACVGQQAGAGLHSETPKIRADVRGRASHVAKRCPTSGTDKWLNSWG